MTLGKVNQRTAERHAQAPVQRHTRRGQRDKRYDRQGREVGLRNPEGRRYSVCVMCSERSMVRTIVSGVKTWSCENGDCGYSDDENGPLN